MRKILLIFIVIIFTVLSSSVQAQDESTVSPVRLLLGLALEVGGDPVAEISFTNGDSQNVRAGQGISAYAGAEFRIPSVEQLLFHATIGFKYVTTAADNANIRLTRVPLHLMAHYQVTKDIRVGGGLALHQSIKYRADGIGPDNDFNAASGPRFEVAYKGFGLTFTGMNYVGDDNLSYAASAFGIAYTFAIPSR